MLGLDLGKPLPPKPDILVLFIVKKVRNNDLTHPRVLEDCTTLEPTLLNLQYRFVCDAGITGTYPHLQSIHTTRERGI
jgi:hypothetical protein